ncbi:histidine protein methyltransferase 1 homolog isoform X2 [Penaeus japonicus]|uniref:histidine protein methyltransferase 1 homolog isoform X2 n=1 Tax=Penaeus japonicus TaxID=27405 RepID=UPI001C7171DD|nr:histidine protein methyltransferase 1 homolog isoform X2 [Penaeus japonicus]
MFRFNFNVESDDQSEPMAEVPVDDPSAKEKSTQAVIDWLPAQCHEITQEHLKYLTDGCLVEEVTIGETEIKYISMNSAVEKLQQTELSSNIAPAFQDHTDLVPAVYEGGLKIWECTWDLLEHLSSLQMNLKGCRVLELGCGAALPGLYTALQGAHVSLQDYNEEVIRYVTIPNAVLNLADSSSLVIDKEGTIDCKFSDASVKQVAERVSFFSGDWSDLERKLTPNIHENSHKFDVILTSETIYNTDCYEKLLHVMTSCLKSNGIIILAAKSHYFGVGGGTQQFIDFVKKHDQLEVKLFVSNSQGLKREILEMRFKNK